MNGASHVPVDTANTLTFDRLMDVAATQAAIAIVPAIGVRPTWSASSVTLTPLAPLSFGTQYEVIVSDQAQTRTATPIAFNFTTVKAGLGLVGVVPSDGSAGAPVGGTITVLFDGPVDLGSAGGLVQIKPPAPGQLSVESVPSDRPGSTSQPTLLVYQPSSPLAPHTTYTVQVLDGMRRAADPSMIAAGRTWSLRPARPTNRCRTRCCSCRRKPVCATSGR